MKCTDFIYKITVVVVIAACTSLLTSTLAVAASVIPEPGDIEINREADAIFDFDMVGAEPVDPENPRVANTALVFTNARNLPSKLRCTAFNKNGHPIGRVWVRLPGKGLRYLLASDFSDESPFVGSARCTAAGDVIGSSVFLGPGLTDLKVRQRFDRHDGISHIIFPLIATY